MGPTISLAPWGLLCAEQRREMGSAMRCLTCPPPPRPTVRRCEYLLQDKVERHSTNTASSPPLQQTSGSSTPSSRSRPTTLDIPGLTRSKVSPDGRIAQRDVGSKLNPLLLHLS